MAKKKKTTPDPVDPPSEMEEEALRSSRYGSDPGIQPYYVNSPPPAVKKLVYSGYIADVEETENVDDTDEEEEEEREYEMEEDVYTLMFAYGGCSFITVYAFGTLFLQVAIVGLFYYDLLQDNTDVNKLNLPVAVDTQVVVAQFMALPLAVMSHEDCTTALYLLSAEYDPAVRENFPGATRMSWHFSLFLRFFVGFLLVFISFIQIVQSTTITDLFLNLEAIVFVGSIDNFAFWLAEKNFILGGFKESCEAVKEISFKASEGHRTTIVRRILAFLTLGVLIAGWLIVFEKQLAGDFLKDKACNSFDVRFPDNTLDLKVKNINLTDSIRSYYFYTFENNETGEVDEGTLDEVVFSAFSGTYRIASESEDKLDIKEQRAVYLEEVPGFVPNGNKAANTFRDMSLGKFLYCQGAWIFTVEAFQHAFDRAEDPDEEECGRWLLRSPPTEEFFLENVPTDGWRIWTGSVERAEGLTIACTDCTGAVDCNYHGECVDKQCVCNEDGFGPTCGLDPPCPQMDMVDIGDSSENFSELDGFTLMGSDGSAATDKNDLLLVYGRPLYSAPLYDNIILVTHYIGSRWSMSVWEQEIFDIYYLSGDAPAHSFWDKLFEGSGFAVSSQSTSGLPLGVDWELNLFSQSRGTYGPFRARSPYTLAFNCVGKDCSGKNLCGDFGICVEGRCECSGCYGGYFCEHGPTDEYAYEQFETFVNTGNATGQYGAFYWSDIDPREACPEDANNVAFPGGGRRSRSLQSRFSP